jgi:hypothetical protein
VVNTVYATDWTGITTDWGMVITDSRRGQAPTLEYVSWFAGSSWFSRGAATARSLTLRLACSRVTVLEGSPTSQPGVDPPLVVVGGESIRLPIEVEAIPEENLVEILAPKGSDDPLDERMRARQPMYSTLKSVYSRAFVQVWTSLGCGSGALLMAPSHSTRAQNLDGRGNQFPRRRPWRSLGLQ